LGFGAFFDDFFFLLDGFFGGDFFGGDFFGGGDDCVLD
jgi:hypothetical protein